jgi:tRNA pseudouridine55 synthase
LDLLHLLDKPEGWTSHDVVARMRRILGERRIGHAGTLDPFATGLLLVAEGRATALLGCLSFLPKRYLATARLGVATDTQDHTGVTIGTSQRLPTGPEIDEAVRNLRGLTRQRPPLYSAVKVRGERLYKAARRGEAPETKERSIRIYELTASYGTLPDLELDLTVSRGTYVRTLAHDLGNALGCGAHLVSLRRIASGPFRIEEALPPEPGRGVPEEAVATAFRSRAKPPPEAIPHLPRVTLTEEESARVRHGRAPTVACDRVEPQSCVVPMPPGEIRWPLALFSPEGDLVALAAAGGQPGGPLQLLRVFP